MSQVHESVEEIRSLARTFQSVINLAEALDKVGSLENAISERTGRIAALDAETESLNKVVQKLKKTNAELEEKATDIIANALTDAAHIRSTAEEEAKAALGEANAKADRITGNANKVDSELSDKVNAVNATLNAKYAELAEVEGKLEKAKASINKLLGG